MAKSVRFESENIYPIKKSMRGLDPSLVGGAGAIDNSRAAFGINMQNISTPYPVQGNPLDERSDWDKIKESQLITPIMASRDKLRIQAINEAAKVGNGYRDFETPNIPDDLNVPFTDGFGYC